jgi:hypothetical protein
MAHRQRVAVVTIRVGDRSGSARSTAKETALRCVPIGKICLFRNWETACYKV